MRLREIIAAFAAVGVSGALVVACAGGANTSVNNNPESDGSADGTMGDGSQTGDSSSGDGTTKPSDGSTSDVVQQADTGGGGTDASAGDADAGCPAPTTLCVDVCVDLQNNPFNCGACNRYCSTGFVCSGGACVYNCPTGQTLCSAFEGGLPDAAVSDASTSDADTDGQSPADAATAPDAETDGGPPSGLYCATLPSDPNNCNGCGVVCPGGNDTPSCVAGVCGIATCNPGFTNCDGVTQNGCEVATGTDPNNCGACGNKCKEPNAVPGCAGGVCNIASCDPGYSDCNNNPSDGCEINTTTDTNNCGTCGTVCNLPNTTSDTCSAGMCGVGKCSPGYADCDSNPANGCETNITNSTGNCGGCGNACNTPNATPACMGSMCVISQCNPGFANCDNQVPDGCEINTGTDPNNCSACGIKCNLPNATSGCANGTCVVAACSPGFSDCDGNPTNGCETPTSTDPNNCGVCGHVCNLPNAVASCQGGTCEVGACNAGFQNCNNVPGDGCEVSTNNDPNNCGGCGHVCFVPNGTAGCGGGNCDVASCNAGFANCDGNAANGCEVNTTNDNNNCGGCGNACLAACGGSNDHTTATQCVSSKCDVTSCSAGYQDFDGQCSNGCECLDSSTQATCPAAQNLFAGTLTPGQSITPFSSTMAPLTVTQAYFTLTFGGNGNPSYHPKVVISSPNNEFLMDVTQDCSGTGISGTDACGDNGTNGSKDTTTWEVAFTNNNVPGMDYYNPIPAVGAGGQVWIRVYRNPLVTPTCNQYTITASD